MIGCPNKQFTLTNTGVPTRLSKGAQKIAWKMRAAGHDMRDRFPIILVPRTIAFEKCVEPSDSFRCRVHRLQPDRDTIIGERELDMAKLWLAAKISVPAPTTSALHRN